jgi:hypothetical protein
MRKITLWIAGILMVSSQVFSAAPGKIQIYADVGRTSCDLTDSEAFFQVYIFHINTDASEGAAFAVVPQGGATVSYFGVSSQFLNFGDPPTGIDVAYGSCQAGTGPIHILTITYEGTGDSPACSSLEVVGDPRDPVPEIYVTDCHHPAPHLLIASGSTAYFNDDGGCPCITPIPVEETSWGKIKALYQ